MADRTSAELCGNIINLLDGYGVTTEVVQRVWGYFMDCDFMPYQTGLSKSLFEKYAICMGCGFVGELPCCEDEEEGKDDDS